MIIETLSDIHLNLTLASPDVDTRSMSGMDFYPYIPQPLGYGDLLIIAGDIGPWDYDAGPYLARLAEETQRSVIFVPGNHEFENGYTIDHTFTSPHPNVAVLQHGASFLIGKYCFIGTTLWSHANLTIKELETSHLFYDFQHIKSPTRAGEYISLKEYVTQHQKEKEILFSACRKASIQGYTPIVITHHAPSHESTHVSFIGNKFNFLFASELNDEILALGDAAPALWIHGHMHNPVDYRIGGTRVINQPLGYKHEIIAGSSATHWRPIDLASL